MLKKNENYTIAINEVTLGNAHMSAAKILSRIKQIENNKKEIDELKTKINHKNNEINNLKLKIKQYKDELKDSPIVLFAGCLTSASIVTVMALSGIGIVPIAIIGSLFFLSSCIDFVCTLGNVVKYSSKESIKTNEIKEYKYQKQSLINENNNLEIECESISEDNATSMISTTLFNMFNDRENNKNDSVPSPVITDIPNQNILKI